MIMYRIKKGQAKALTKRKYDNGISFNPVQDINGDWFIGEEEINYCVLYFGFEPEEAEFIPPKLEEPI